MLCKQNTLSIIVVEGLRSIFVVEGLRGQRHAPAALYPWERPGTHCTGGWVGPRAGLDRCGKSRPHRDSIPGPSSPERVAIPTTLPAPRLCFYQNGMYESWGRRALSIILSID